MSGDYETLEINQPKITYFQKRSENNTEWLDELINQIIEDKKIIKKDPKNKSVNIIIKSLLGRSMSEEEINKLLSEGHPQAPGKGLRPSAHPSYNLPMWRIVLR